MRFAEALGLTPRALEGIEIDFSVDTDLAGGALAGLSPEEIRRRGLENRADLKAALAEYEATQSALQLEIARQYPDVRIGPGYEYDQGLNKWAVVGISVELPVMNRNQGPIGEAEARRSEAAARFVALQAQAIAEIDRALANQEAAREALRRSESLLAAEHERVRATAQALRAGAVDRLALRTRASRGGSRRTHCARRQGSCSAGDGRPRGRRPAAGRVGSARSRAGAP